MEVRDPIHGTMRIADAEVPVVDHPWVQRLRHVAQTGFAVFPFPGATHSRFAHSLGVMHLAGRAFDEVYAGWTFDQPDARERLRAAVRLGALCHDLGHAPFSHCTEFAMPDASSLGLTWVRASGRRATHEDYTLAVLEHTDLGDVIGANTPFTARHVGALIAPEVRTGDDFFRDGGFDHRCLLSQIVSSELDVDRLDYLVRDASFTGATYGHIDVDWLLSNLAPLPKDGQVQLALDGRAIYAFDDFLISRHHMFLMVYFHHKSVVYEEMLKRHVDAPDVGWSLPADLDAYLRFDDVAMWAWLRAARDPWAHRLVERRPWKRVLERHGNPQQASVDAEEQRLAAEGFDPIAVTSTGRLSRYRVGAKRRSAPSIWVIDEGRRPARLEDATEVFGRYADARCISRIYVAPEDVERARSALS